MADRAVSEVLGFALVFALVVSIVALVSVFGLAGLQETRDAEQVNNAERAFDVLADNVADLHQRGAPSRATEISLADARIYTGEELVVNVSGVDTSNPNDNFSVEYGVRPIVYDADGGSQLIYSLGAVIRQDPGGGLVIRDPPFLLGTDRTVVPVVQTRSRAAQTLAGGTMRVRAERTAALNPVAVHDSPYDRVWLNVTSPRASVWVDHLEDYPDTSCTLETGGATDIAVCEVTHPDRVYATVVRVDVELEK